MMERLTKFVTPVGLVMTNLNSMKHYMPCVPCRHNAKIKYDSNGNGYTEKFSLCDTCEVKMLFNKLKEYEDLEEQGLLLRLPVPIRTGWSKYYWIDEESGEITILNDNGYRIFKPTNDLTVYEIDSYDFLYEAFGKTVFLTREEAEAKMKEMESE